MQRVRDVLPADFVIAIKLNAADYVQGGMTEEAALGHVKDIATWAQEGYGVDLIEISGGNYENLRALAISNCFVCASNFDGWDRIHGKLET